MTAPARANPARRQRGGGEIPPVHENRDRGEASRLLPSHTTVHAGPHTAVRRVERLSDRQSRNPKRVKVGIVQLRQIRQEIQGGIRNSTAADRTEAGARKGTDGFHCEPEEGVKASPMVGQ